MDRDSQQRELLPIFTVFPFNSGFEYQTIETNADANLMIMLNNVLVNLEIFKKNPACF